MHGVDVVVVEGMWYAVLRPASESEAVTMGGSLHCSFPWCTVVVRWVMRALCRERIVKDVMVRVKTTVRATHCFMREAGSATLLCALGLRPSGPR